jgi:hypothetical protein
MYSHKVKNLNKNSKIGIELVSFENHVSLSQHIKQKHFA